VTDNNTSPDQAPEIPDSLRKEWETLKAGTVEILPETGFRDRLVDSRKAGRPLRVKLGADPSAPDLHLGHSVVLNKLRQFQDFGHHVIFIIGDFTASIGDPTGKSETRPSLTSAEVSEHARSYLEQVFLILDRDKTEVVENSSWFKDMSFSDVIKLTSQYTVARMLERDDFEKRYRENRAIHIHEFLYPLVQGYDSIEVRADIEVGGTDQKFNLLVGRDLMREAGMNPQCIMTMPLLTGLDGVHKMSKSLGNYIGLTDTPADIFGKTMSIPDDMMKDYLVLTLGYMAEAAHGLLGQVSDNQIHPRDLKARISRELTERYHGPDQARLAEEQFNKVFRQKENPDEIKTISLEGEPGRTPVFRMMVGAGLAASNAEAKRLIKGGGVSLDGQKISDQSQVVEKTEFLLKVGKRHFKRIRLT
jgi:tyrosyl-tRNA synthetase